MFSNNTASLGGAIYSEELSGIIFEETSSTVFSNNNADVGGAILSYENIAFEGNSSTVVSYNTATEGGGAIRSSSNSNVFLKGMPLQYLVIIL